MRPKGLKKVKLFEVAMFLFSFKMAAHLQTMHPAYVMKKKKEFTQMGTSRSQAMGVTFGRELDKAGLKVESMGCGHMPAPTNVAQQLDV